MVEAGHEVRVFTIWDREPENRPPWLYGLSRFNPVPVRLLAILLRLLRHVSWSELVYVNGLELPAMLAARLRNKPAVIKIVGDYAWERARLRGETELEIDPYQLSKLDFKLDLQRRLRGFYTRLARVVITPSRYLERLVRGWGVRAERVRMIYNGLTPLPENSPGHKPSSDGNLIVTAARLVDWKGIDHLIEALSLMSQPARLRVLGDGQEMGNLKDLAEKLGVADRVEFPGRVDRREVLGAMAEADVFVLASGYEGLPHVVLEAMAVGVPVVATAAGGTPEVVIDEASGLVVPHNDPPRLAKALDRIMGSPELAVELSQGGLARAKEFPWQRTVDENIGLIEELVIG